MTYELIEHVWDYQDGPKSGIAKFNDQLCFFDAAFDDEIDEFQNLFDIYPVDESVLKLFEYIDLNFTPWKKKFDEGLVDPGSHPLHSNKKYAEVAEKINNLRSELTPITPKTRGEIRIVEPEGLTNGLRRKFEICWKPLESQ